jgi:hemerythrin-like metal-binding protein
MQLIRLEEDSRLNVPEIDAQHEKLIGLINQLHTAMLREADKSSLDGLLSQLLDHTRSHCSYEEELMSRYGYPEYASHRSEHRRLVEHLENLIDRYEKGDLLLSFAVMLELKGWATIHIGKSDKLLGIFLNDRAGIDFNHHEHSG